MNDKISAKTRKAFSRFDILAALCLLAGFVFLLWKAPYGYAQADENFYLSIPYRLFQGDSLLAHEWNSAQLFSFLLYPAMKLFISFNGSTEGIFLFFRYLYTAALLLGGIYVYISLRRVQPVGALLGALLLMLYTPLHIMSLSYNTMCILLLAAAGATMVRAASAKAPAWISGLLFAGAVLCCPYLVVIYAVYSLLCLLPRFTKKLSIPAFSLAFWLRFTAGCAVLALVFLVFVLSRCSLSDAIASIPLIFNDTETFYTSFSYHLFKYCEAIYGNFWVNSFSLSWPILALIMALDKKRKAHRCWYIVPAMLITATYFAYYVFSDRTVNYLMFPMNILGGFAFFLCNKRDIRPFVFLYIPGLLYSLCIHFASNLGLMSIASAMSVSCIASAIYICTLAKELYCEDKKLITRIVGLGLLLALMMQLSVLSWFRSRYTMWDDDTSELSITLTEGPQKGIITGEGHASRYYKLIEDSSPVREAQADCVLYIFTDSWLYLMDDARMGSFSPWISTLYPETDIARLESYWQLYPERMPDTIFIGERKYDITLGSDKSGKLELLMDALPGSWTVTETESGCILRP